MPYNRQAQQFKIDAIMSFCDAKPTTTLNTGFVDSLHSNLKLYGHLTRKQEAALERVYRAFHVDAWAEINEVKPYVAFVPPRPVRPRSAFLQRLETQYAFQDD